MTSAALSGGHLSERPGLTLTGHRGSKICLNIRGQVTRPDQNFEPRNVITRRGIMRATGAGETSITGAETRGGGGGCFASVAAMLRDGEGVGVVSVPLPCCRPSGGVVPGSSCRVPRRLREEANHEIAAHEEPPTKRYFPILGSHVKVKWKKKRIEKLGALTGGFTRGHEVAGSRPHVSNPRRKGSGHYPAHCPPWEPLTRPVTPAAGAPPARPPTIPPSLLTPLRQPLNLPLLPLSINFLTSPHPLLRDGGDGSGGSGAGAGDGDGRGCG
ncbi:hypothetical protein E2C01_038163 [Portunus trituberculatus]|uniref:Uncharacterized protein n=1 Tax=Portunus trituberculatus TaxID=210409 RepID=A0A5B7FA48_PORTR|nr:hypothetical protein [Portunus trituberculatus]